MQRSKFNTRQIGTESDETENHTILLFRKNLSKNLSAYVNKMGRSKRFAVTTSKIESNGHLLSQILNLSFKIAHRIESVMFLQKCQIYIDYTDLDCSSQHVVPFMDISISVISSSVYICRL